MKVANWSTDGCPPYSSVPDGQQWQIKWPPPTASTAFVVLVTIRIVMCSRCLSSAGTSFSFLFSCPVPPSPRRTGLTLFSNTFSEASDEDTFAALWEIGKVYSTKTIFFLLKRSGITLFKMLNVRVLYFIFVYD